MSYKILNNGNGNVTGEMVDMSEFNPGQYAQMRRAGERVALDAPNDPQLVCRFSELDNGGYYIHYGWSGGGADRSIVDFVEDVVTGEGGSWFFFYAPNQDLIDFYASEGCEQLTDGVMYYVV